jgi:chaperonin cofactor prefoldin
LFDEIANDAQTASRLPPGIRSGGFSYEDYPMRLLDQLLSRLLMMVFGLTLATMYFCTSTPAQSPTPDVKPEDSPVLSDSEKEQRRYTRFRREAMYDSLSRTQQANPWSDVVLGTYVDVYNKTRNAEWAEMAANSVDRFGRKVFDAYRKGDKIDADKTFLEIFGKHTLNEAIDTAKDIPHPAAQVAARGASIVLNTAQDYFGQTSNARDPQFFADLARNPNLALAYALSETENLKKYKPITNAAENARLNRVRFVNLVAKKELEGTRAQNSMIRFTEERSDYRDSREKTIDGLFKKNEPFAQKKHIKRLRSLMKEQQESTHQLGDRVDHVEARQRALKKQQDTIAEWLKETREELKGQFGELTSSQQQVEHQLGEVNQALAELRNKADDTANNL